MSLFCCSGQRHAPLVFQGWDSHPSATANATLCTRVLYEQPTHRVPCVASILKAPPFAPRPQHIAVLLRLSPDIAGITLLAFASGAPDIFTELAAINGGTLLNTTSASSHTGNMCCTHLGGATVPAQQLKVLLLVRRSCHHKC